MLFCSVFGSILNHHIISNVYSHRGQCETFDLINSKILTLFKFKATNFDFTWIYIGTVTWEYLMMRSNVSWNESFHESICKLCRQSTSNRHFASRIELELKVVTCQIWHFTWFVWNASKNLIDLIACTDWLKSILSIDSFRLNFMKFEISSR